MKKRSLNRKTTHVPGDTELGRSWGYVRVTPQRYNENVPISNVAIQPTREVVSTPPNLFSSKIVTPLNRVPFVNERVIAVSSSKKPTSSVEVLNTPSISRIQAFSKEATTADSKLNEVPPISKAIEISEPFPAATTLTSDNTITELPGFPLRLKKSLANERNPLREARYRKNDEQEYARRVKDMQHESSITSMFPSPKGEKYSMVNVILRKLQNQTVKKKPPLKSDSSDYISLPLDLEENTSNPVSKNPSDSLSLSPRNLAKKDVEGQSPITYNITLDPHNSCNISPIYACDHHYEPGIQQAALALETRKLMEEGEFVNGQQITLPMDKDIQTSKVQLHNQTTQTDTPLSNVYINHVNIPSPSTTSCGDNTNNPCFQSDNQEQFSQQHYSKSSVNHQVQTTDTKNEIDSTAIVSHHSLHEFNPFQSEDSNQTNHRYHDITSEKHRSTSQMKDVELHEFSMNDALPIAILNKNAIHLSKPKKPFNKALDQFLHENNDRTPAMPTTSPTSSTSLNNFPSSDSYNSYTEIEHSYLSEDEVIHQLNAIKIACEADDYKVRKKAFKDLRALSMILVGSHYETLLRKEFTSTLEDEAQHVVEDVLRIFERNI